MCYGRGRGRNVALENVLWRREATEGNPARNAPPVNSCPAFHIPIRKDFPSPSLCPPFHTMMPQHSCHERLTHLSVLPFVSCTPSSPFRAGCMTSRGKACRHKTRRHECFTHARQSCHGWKSLPVGRNKADGVLTVRADVMVESASSHGHHY